VRRLRLVFEDAALLDLEEIATRRQIQRVIEAMENMARSGWSLGPSAPSYAAEFHRDIHYWSVPPLAVFYAVEGMISSW
jgi:hypothetical protein